MLFTSKQDIFLSTSKREAFYEAAEGEMEVLNSNEIYIFNETGVFEVPKTLWIGDSAN